MNISVTGIENHWHRRQTRQKYDLLVPIITLFLLAHVMHLRSHLTTHLSTTNTDLEEKTP